MRYHPPMTPAPRPPSVADPSLPSQPSAAADETVVEGDGDRSRREPILGRGDAVGRYLLLDALGRGAMGLVFRAYDPDLDRQVAIKILHEPADHGPAARERLLGEAKAMARIHHPNVVTVHDAGVHDDAVFIAMEIVDGPSLDRWLDTPRTPAPILDVFLDAARGLAAAHAAGVIHRDFKPANVLVTADGRAKVGDFGLAGIEEPTTGQTAASKPGHAMGTPAYMSPEHFAGVDIDARSDQFSFAIALYEALHGTRPFSATTWPQLAAQVTTGAIDPALAGRRGGIDGIIRRALSVDPEQRFPSMDALITALERARRPVWRTWATVGALALALGMAVLGERETADAERCEPGAERVRAVWNAKAKAALNIGGSDYSAAFARLARARFEQALDDYAARWTVAHDESCAVVGPAAQRGTLREQHAAQCLENRLGSLQGMVALMTAESLDAGRVGALVDTLPAIDDCREGGTWIPYPSDPVAAARVAELFARFERIFRMQVIDRGEEVREDARVALADARALGEPYPLAYALGRSARATSDPDEADELRGEALRIAIAEGFDRVVLILVNDALVTTDRSTRATSSRELGYLVAVARGMVERSGASDWWLGNLALNEANILRQAGKLAQAERSDILAEEHFARAGNAVGVAKARLNHAVTMGSQGRYDEALPRLRAALEVIEANAGTTAPEVFQGQQALIGVLSRGGRPHDAYAVAADSLRRARELYAPGSYTLRWSLLTYAVTTLNAGHASEGLEAVASLRALPGGTTREQGKIDLLELSLVQLTGRHHAVLAMLPAVRSRFGPDDLEDRAWLEASAAASMFVLGQHDAVRETLASPTVLGGLGSPGQHEELQTQVVLLATLVGSEAPAGSTWRALLPTTTSRPHSKKLREVIDALDTSEPVPVVVRVRDELAAAYAEADIHVQLLDAWLADTARHPAP
jgi:eukaryotic-like serine/threonine-protein kinase